MPIFANILNIVESASVFYGRINPGRSHYLFIWLLSIFYVILSEFVIRVCIHSSINFGIEFSFFYQFGSFNIFHISSFGGFFFKFIFREVHILNQIRSSPVGNIIEGVMNLLLSILFLSVGACTDDSFWFERFFEIFFSSFGLIFKILMSILSIGSIWIFTSFTILRLIMRFYFVLWMFWRRLGWLERNMLSLSFKMLLRMMLFFVC